MRLQNIADWMRLSRFTEGSAAAQGKAKHCWLPIASAFLLLFVVSCPVEAATVLEISANPMLFDGRSVAVEGTADDVLETTSHAGNGYSTFQLRDGAGDAVTVFTWGHPNIRNGNQVQVIGVFQQVRHVGHYTFNDEIDAQSVRQTSNSSAARRLNAITNHDIAGLRRFLTQMAHPPHPCHVQPSVQDKGLQAALDAEQANVDRIQSEEVRKLFHHSLSDAAYHALNERFLEDQKAVGAIQDAMAAEVDAHGFTCDPGRSQTSRAKRDVVTKWAH